MTTLKATRSHKLNPVKQISDSLKRPPAKGFTGFGSVLVDGRGKPAPISRGGYYRYEDTVKLDRLIEFRGVQKAAAEPVRSSAKLPTWMTRGAPTLRAEMDLSPDPWLEPLEKDVTVHEFETV